MENNYLISVIIPVYNSEKYLLQCVNSVLNQTYKNIEILLIDDCSTDSSFDVCKKLKDKYDNISVYQTKKNSGSASTARNIGLDNSNGDFIAFLDSDDFVFPTMYEKLLKICIDYNCDIAKCSTIDINNREFPVVENEKNKVLIYSGRDLMKTVFQINPIYNVAPCNKIYRKKIFAKLRFPESIIYEDEAIVMQILNNADTIAVTNEVLYCYFLSDNSVMRNNFNEKRFNIFDAYKIRYDFLKQNNLDDIILRSIVMEYIIACSMYYYIYINKDIKDRDKYLHKIEEVLMEARFQNINNNKYFEFKQKIYALVLIKFPYIFKLVDKLHTI